MILGGFGCGSKSITSTHFEDILKHIGPLSIEPPDENSQFNFSCEENLMLFMYVKENHLMGDQLNLELLLKKAMQKIVSNGKFPVPYFYSNRDRMQLLNSENKYSTPENLVAYFEFDLSSDQSQKINQELERFKTLSSFCNTVLSVARIIDDSSKMRTDLALKKVDSLFHKGILRYLIESLDPHSQVYDWIELKYGVEHLKNYLALQREEHLFPLTSLSDPYLIKDNDPAISGKWIQGSSVYDIEMTEFNKQTKENFYRLYLEAYREKEIKGLVIDLRRNHGGNAVVVSELADLFIKEGPTLLILQRSEGLWYPTIFEAENGNELPLVDQIPVVLLVSRHSASSSETFAAAMKDHNAAILIGERTFGKGTGQISDFIYRSPFFLNGYFHLTLSIAYTFTPRGVPIQISGIMPDIELADHDYARMIPKDFEREYLAFHEDKYYTNHLPIPGSLTVQFKENILRKDRKHALKDRLQKYFSERNNAFTVNDFADALH